jgi:SecD/SecF fusion protein
MTANPLLITQVVLYVVVAGLLYLAYRRAKPFFWRIFLCIVPLLLAQTAVSVATEHYMTTGGGFKLGVDLVGGTILVYQVDPDKMDDEKWNTFKPEELAARLKRRIDPTDLYNVTIRPVGRDRVEIILPTGGLHQAQIEERDWQALMDRVHGQWPQVRIPEGGVRAGDVATLVDNVSRQAHVAAEDVDAFINETYKPAKYVTAEEVQTVKERIAQVGSLEFRILANGKDDKDGVSAATQYVNDPANADELKRRALRGLPPPPPVPAEGTGFTYPNGARTFSTPKGNFSYTWVELGRQERQSLGLNNAARDNPNWKRAHENLNKAIELSDGSQTLLYSRPCENINLTPEKRREKEFEYFLLVRDPERDPNTGEMIKISGSDLASASAGNDEKLRLAVHFRFNTRGGDLFYRVTSNNTPEGSFYRHLAIILDDQIVSAPRLNQAIRTDGQISGNFTQREVDNLVSVLRSGALPATLKPQPVSENTMGATLGADTIFKGTVSVGLAFAAILIFMAIYYRFAGLVACIALLANLLLTVAFMVIVNATFTLPGLAGLVLMLGMAVDANVLIYERLREERDRGASLALSIRNGYDRAFPTIIDTHLSSIFTAIVLYVVGNDQLKGFGVSLTVGLIISLFTSLYMTRLLFDLWLARNWLHKLSMFRLFSRPNIDFMGWRRVWFTTTVVLTVIGITVFVLRLPSDLNIDFVGGTAYGGQLKQSMDISTLREQLGDKSQLEHLQVVQVKQLHNEQNPSEDGYAFEITYRDADGKETTRRIHFTNRPVGDKASAPEREADVKARASQLPDWSVEQIFPSNEPQEGSGSRYFTVRTSEKAPELVQATIGKLLGEHLRRVEMSSYEINPSGKRAILHFKDPAAVPGTATGNSVASRGQVAMLLDRAFTQHGIHQQPVVDDKGVDPKDGTQTMELDLSEPVAVDQLKRALVDTQQELAARPQPDRLENFDSQLAADTQTRAMYAILASWGAILLYLWFRFGSWTFGLATVLCLIHDLFFTLGIIAFCHYIHLWAPGVANALLLQDFKIDLPAVAALLTLVGYSTNDTIVVFDRIREVRGKNPELTPQMINDSVNQTLSRTLLTSFATWLVVIVLYVFGGEGVHLFAFVMVVGVIVGTYSSIYIASPLLLIFGEGARHERVRETRPQPVGAPA